MPSAKVRICLWYDGIKWGVFWQITPVALSEGLSDSGPAARRRRTA